ncbi:hypothetical protein H9Q13_12425 [Pontibacter sp. JH31]|uniref:Uncharacterized protein n=1 Tax=Pontibacter aquaedesilientis TaxID=2766980 RepID=A0ABR7XIA1_9BACT|nr:hypothetical protein [Pontibacter aquaedesilientis]MBD1397974.1 hypothetical protein [Pontibacter aquaedesilientis]
MEKKQDKHQPPKTTKEMSTDVNKVKGQQQSPPPQGTGENDPTNTKDDSSDAEAQKGHA